MGGVLIVDLGIRTTIDRIAEISHELIVSSKDFNNQNLEDAIEASGIDVRYFVDKNYDGFLKWDTQQNCPIIAVNANQAPVRQRFSMAHELGHLILDWNWIPYSNNNKSFDKDKVLNVTLFRGVKQTPEETKVNEFAAAFLMPDSLLKKITDEVKERKISYAEAIEKIKSIAGVSGVSAGYRFKHYCQEKGLKIVDE